MAQRDTPGTLTWYRQHRTTSQIGFDPDGMCLKICRTARNIGPRYGSAIAAQEATPTDDRVYDISKITTGMIVYYDDPKDSNPYGHIVTVVGRKGGNKNSLSDLVVDTNSVQANRLTTVAGDYFGRYWGDEFQFAATSLNGVDLLLPTPVKPMAPKKDHLPTSAEARLRAILKEYDRMIAKTRQPRLEAALKRDRASIAKTIKEFG